MYSSNIHLHLKKDALKIILRKKTEYFYLGQTPMCF